MSVSALLAPLFVLVLWSFVMMVWMVARRIPGLKGLDLPKENMVGGRGQDLDAVLPKRLNWPAHNYTHLMEQPTVFYPTVLALALMGQATTVNVALAWTYVALRIAHSLWQTLVNTIPVRASLFFLSSFVLIALAVNGLMGAMGR